MQPDYSKWHDTIVDILRQTAMDVSTQIALVPEYVRPTDDIAENVEYALMLCETLAKVGAVSPRTVAVLTPIHAVMERHSGKADPAFWTHESLANHRDWTQVRESARMELVALGHELRPPSLNWVTYVPGELPARGNEPGSDAKDPDSTRRANADPES